MKLFVPVRYFVCLTSLMTIVSCGATTTSGTTPDGDCKSGIEYQGREYSAKAGWREQLNIEANSQVKAVREVSDTMKIYLEEAANLCSLYKRGEMPAVDYANARSALSQRFAGLVSITQDTPPQSVPQEEQQIYLETIASFERENPSAPLPTPTNLTVRVTADGRQLSSGDQLASGQGFHIQVDVPNRSYLYIVLIDSSGVASRLYPAELTGTGNPVQGTIDIPNEPGAEFSLDDVTGTERLLVYAQPRRSKAIEDLLSEVAKDGAAAPVKEIVSKVTDVLTRGINVRDKINKAADQMADQICATTRGVGVRKKNADAAHDTCNPSKGSANQVNSALGLATVQFVIDHI